MSRAIIAGEGLLGCHRRIHCSSCSHQFIAVMLSFEPQVLAAATFTGKTLRTQNLYVG